jgi:hypothetical protein
MYKWQYEKANITEDSKIIIALGDSFTQGQGACKTTIWDRYNWDLKVMQTQVDSKILHHEYEGAWVNQLCKNHMPDWTPINLGLRGCGNRATVKELYLHPNLGIEKAKEKIVIFLATGLERFDFINNSFGDHHHFFAMWPNPWDPTATDRKLWEAYAENVYSNKFACIEFLLNVAEVKTWCKANNAKFMLCSAFDNRINKKFFEEHVPPYNRDFAGLSDIIDWDALVKFDEQSIATDMLMNLEGKLDMGQGAFYSWAREYERGTPKGYFTPCSHPSYKGHGEIARCFYEYINNSFKNK